MNNICQIVLMNSKKEICQIRGFLSSFPEVNLIEPSDVQKILSWLELAMDIKGIVVIGLSHETTKLLSQALQKIRLKIPLIYIGETDPDILFVEYVPATSFMSEKISRTSGILGLQLNLYNETAFTPIPIHYFQNLHDIFCDVYLRIKKAGQAPQFIKRISAHEIIDQEIIENYQEGGISHLYIPSEFDENFMFHYTNHSMNKLTDCPSSIQESIGLNSTIFDFLQENIIRENFKDNIIELGHESIKNVTESIKSDHRLREFYNLMTSTHSTFHFQKTYLTVLVIHNLLHSFSWVKNEHRTKMTYAAFFNDITLTSEESLKIRSQSELLNMTVSREEKNKIQRHCLEAIEKLDFFTGLPEGVVTIIREHHGDKNGILLKEDPDPDLAPLSLLYIVAEDFAFQFMQQAGRPVVLNIINELKKKYTSDSIKKIIRLLELTFT